MLKYEIENKTLILKNFQVKNKIIKRMKIKFNIKKIKGDEITIKIQF